MRITTIEMRMTGKEAFCGMLTQDYSILVWGRLYKRDLFKEIRFPDGKLCEDLGIIYKLFLASEKVIFNNEVKYYYVLHKNSLAHLPYNEKQMEDVMTFGEEIRKEANREGIEMEDKITLWYFQKCIYFMAKMCDIQREDAVSLRSKMYGVLKQNRAGLLWNVDVKLKWKIVILLSYLPFPIFDRIVDFTTRSKHYRRLSKGEDNE